jgi:stearoyl-CoA desaturase (delta-9 desaturase)
MGIIFPALVSCLWGDFWGGFFYPVWLRVVIVHHSTFLVNSVAHYWGDTTYDDEYSARDNILIFSEKNKENQRKEKKKNDIQA